jgi:two-component sensor histidine kinase
LKIGSASYVFGGASEMAGLMREHDWSTSPLGDPTTWPQALRTATAMMLNTSQPMFIAWGEKLGFIYNDAYAPVLGARHPAALGRPFENIWGDIWDDLGPLVRSALAGAPTWQEDLPLLMHRHGYPEQTYFTFTYSPLHDETGHIAGMFCTCIETTGRVAAERALAQSEARYREQGERLFTLFEKAPGFVAVLDGPEHVFTLANEAYRQLIGHRDVIGSPVRAVIPEVAASGLFEVLDRIYRTGEPYIGQALAVDLQRRPDAATERRVVDFVYQPIRGDAGEVTGIFVQGNDVTAREEHADKQRLLLNELNHRVKNNLATVQSMAAQTARSAPSLGAFLADFEGRLVALARTHDVLTAQAWEGADLHEVVRAELEHVGARATFQGPATRLGSKQALGVGLIVHELATNAAKYGALLRSEGTLRVSWTDTGDNRFQLRWVESGGPAVTPPTVRGFGSRLIQSVTRGDLHGQIEMDYAAEGLQVTLTGLCSDPS